jgi:acetylornithine/N-succinyldiaminopimelate aminotransferase|tara:strand:- start:5622 stop:7124 length:1503 start_codon:yes stop_codon:yes gene_type:complete
MLLEDQIPRIQKLISEKLGGLPKNALQNDMVMRTTFMRLHRMLPRFIRIAVGEATFVEFCMANRDRLLSFKGAVQERMQETDPESQTQDKTQTDLEMEEQMKELQELSLKVYLPTYPPKPLVLERSRGAVIWDLQGKDYIDFGAGIAVSSLGHQDPELLLAISEQASKLWHTSNLFLTEPPVRLAAELVEASFADRVFFCNSGAEANEAAIKLVRKYAYLHHPEDKREILSFDGSFHGRTLATVTATSQPKYQEGFGPLPGGFDYAPYNDFEAAEKAIGPQTCAVLVEPLQGEGGVNPARPGFLKHLRELCDRHQALLIYDEIQCGMGRTGKLFGYEWEEGVHPDVLTMAKALGCGLPIGAMLCTEKVAESFKPGDHGTTFGGNPIVATVARAALKKINTPQMMAHVIKQGEAIRGRLHSLNDELDLFGEIRGKGLMLGGVLHKDWKGRAGEIVSTALKYGVLVLVAGPDVVRFVPPLTISGDEVQSGLERLTSALKELA